MYRKQFFNKLLTFFDDHKLMKLLNSLLLLSISFAVIFFAKYLRQPIYDNYGFRQAQTAMTIRYLHESPSILDYETPVMGVPWSIPFEFPTYQWLVSLFVNQGSLEIAVVGRLVSIVFFLLSILVCTAILKELGANRRSKKIFLILCFSSPMYLFWSRTVMIESTALFLALLFLYLQTFYLRNKSYLIFLLSVLAGSLAAATKITTFLPIAGAGTLLAFLYPTFESKQVLSKLKNNWHYIGALIFCVLIGIIWNSHADALKNANVVSSNYITSEALHSWNFGTLQQRLSWNVLKVLWERTNNIISILPLLFLTILVVKGKGRSNLAACILILAFLSGYFVFINLHFVHAYYQYANGILLLAGVSLLLGENYTERRWVLLAYLILGFTLIFNYSDFFKTNLQWARNQDQRVLSLGKYIRENTNSNSVMIVSGLDWSSEMPFEAERKALMISSFPEDIFVPKYNQALDNLLKSNETISALVLCDKTYTNWILPRILKDFRFGSTPTEVVSGCDIYLANGM